MKRKNTGKGWNTFSAVVLSVLILAEALAMFQVWKLNMLPVKYFLAALAAVAALTAVIALMLFVKTGKFQKKVSHGRQILAYLFSAVIIGGCVFGFSAIAKLNGTLSSITDNHTNNTLMDVYVLADDPAEAIADTAGYVFGVSGSTKEAYNQAVAEEIQAQLGSQIQTAAFENAFAMIDALYAGQVDAVIIDSAFVGVAEEVEGYADFAEKTRLIFEYVIEEQKDISQDSEMVQSTPVKDVTNTPFLLYISGNDARKALLANGGSDVNILVAVNPKDHQILMVNTPRDYYVGNPAGNGAKDKLSHLGLEGIENSLIAMTELYGQPINYYAKINFSGFQTLVDAIGGVTIYSDVAFTAGKYYPIKVGENHLNGKEALAFARERKAVSGGDNGRGKNQMKLIAAMIDQLSASSLLANYSEILGSLEGMFTTSLSSQELASLVKLQLSEMPSWDILTFAVTGDNGNDTCYAVGGGYGYVMYPHEHMVSHASDLLGRVLAGEVLTEDDLTVN